jgi:hypothetical protein
METDKYSVQDLVNFSYQQKPADFKIVFDDLILDRLAAAVDNKKYEIAQDMFNGNHEQVDGQE